MIELSIGLTVEPEEKKNTNKKINFLSRLETASFYSILQTSESKTTFFELNSSKGSQQLSPVIIILATHISFPTNFIKAAQRSGSQRYSSTGVFCIKKQQGPFFFYHMVLEELSL